MEVLFAHSSPSDATSSYVFADYALSAGSLVVQVDFVVAEVEDSAAVAVEVVVVPVPAVPVLAAVAAVAVDDEDMVSAAALKVVDPQVIVVLVSVPGETHRFAVAFRAD